MYVMLIERMSQTTYNKRRSLFGSRSRSVHVITMLLKWTGYRRHNFFCKSFITNRCCFSYQYDKNAQQSEKERTNSFCNNLEQNKAVTSIAVHYLFIHLWCFVIYVIHIKQISKYWYWYLISFWNCVICLYI